MGEESNSQVSGLSNWLANGGIMSGANAWGAVLMKVDEEFSVV